MRSKVLRAARKLRHRYDLLRGLSQSFTLGVLLLVPLSGLARVDLWRGDHRLWFHPAPLNHALAGVILGIAASYVVTFLSNVAAGRMFCGWGCPAGQVSRFGEAAAWEKSPQKKLRINLAGAAYSAAVVVAMFAWWCDPRVLILGSPDALLAGWATVATGVALAWAHGRFWRWEFCKQVCPIGLYYSFVSLSGWYGVHFRDRERLCIGCNACDNVCPVGLAPRDLATPIPARAGLSIAGAPGRNHCLECGDCVRACEMVLTRKGPAPVPLHLGYFRGPQREVGEVGEDGGGARRRREHDLAATAPRELG
jgi:polyferredoxin